MKLATLAYVRRGDQTLMLRRPAAGHHQSGKYNGLGGKLRRGESPEECLRREVREESGLIVERAVLKGFLSFPDFDGQADWYVFVYLVLGSRGEVVPSAEGDLEWVPTAAVAALPLWPGDRHFLPWLDQPGTFSATFRYLGGRFVGYEVERYAS